MSFRSIFLAATALVATANAHIKMSSPVPYSADKVDTSPISKAQFPCKSQNGFTVTKMNPMKVGEEMPLQLDGTAVHGGGSCQLSVTLDTEPTANSVFKVIKSMEGGCPGLDGKPNNYTFTLPDSIPNGKATFAWTWMSKLAGQAELYMNCAPIEVSGGSDDKSGFEALPDMLVINIDSSCKQVEGSAVEFPNPGKVVEKGNTNDLKPPVGCASGSTPADPSSPAGGSPSSAPSSTTGGAPSAAPSYPAGGASPSGTDPPVAGQPSTAPTSTAVGKPSAAPVPSNGGGVFAPGASSGSPAGPTGTPALPSTSTTLVTVTATPTVPLGTGSPAAPTAPSTGGGSTTPSTPSTGGGSGTCSQNGAIVCNGSTQFGICNNGNVVWQAVASGTTCSNGSITKRAYHGRIVRPRLSNRLVAN